jgi:hypothetical protein
MWKGAWPAALAVAAALGTARSATAAVEEPDGLLVPQPVRQSEQDDVRSLTSLPGASVTLPELFRFRGEAIDYQADAAVAGAFWPGCDVSATLVLHGGNCTLALGWYNAVADGGAAPPEAIHALIPSDDGDVDGCGPFCPLAADGEWTLKTFTLNDIQTDRRYAGGSIGFALLGDPLGTCSQTHYSQPELNQVCTSCSPSGPRITALSYASTVEPDAYYLAFEDLPTSETSFGGDGDFNDGAPGPSPASAGALVAAALMLGARRRRLPERPKGRLQPRGPSPSAASSIGSMASTSSASISSSSFSA